MTWNYKNKTKLGIAAAVTVALVFCIVKYSAAYKNSAEWITITISDKEVQTYTDEDGGSSTTYLVRSHHGEEFNCRGRGWNGSKTLYNTLRVDHQYKVLVAGLGYLNRDILENQGLIPLDLAKPEK